MKASYITPAVTLFKENGRLDLESQARLYDNLIANGIDGILVQGSIGEFFSMSMDMRRELAGFAIRTIDHRVRLIIGTSSMMFDDIAPFSNECLEKGADAVIVVPPYYFPMDNDAIFAYFDRLATDIHGPLYLYNFPDRTGYSIAADTVLRLARKHSNIIGIKDTIPGVTHTRELIKLLKPEYPDFEIYSGFDDNLAANVLAGGDGCIGGLSNIFPEICAGWVGALRSDDANAIARYQRIVDRLFDIYSVGSTFIPVIKDAVRQRGFATCGKCTFPIAEVNDAQRARIKKIIDRALNDMK